MDCPYLDSDKPHCSEQLNMGQLPDALERCTGRYDLCPVYLALRGEMILAEAATHMPAERG